MCPSSEQSHDIIQAKLVALDLVTTKRRRRYFTLLVLQLENPLLDRLLDHQLINHDIALLTISMDTTERLLLLFQNRISTNWR